MHMKLESADIYSMPSAERNRTDVTHLAYKQKRWPHCWLSVLVFDKEHAEASLLVFARFVRPSDIF